MTKAESEETAPDAQEVARAAVEEKIAEQAILKESLDQARAQAKDYYDQLLRLTADFENYRKRTEREKVDQRRWGKEEVLLPLISLMDVVEQAEIAAHKTTDMKSIVAGLDMLYSQFKKLLKDEGIEFIDPAGEKFNPELHEAVELVPDEGEEGRVLSVMQKGYKSQGQLLRPARVRVSAKREGEKKE